MKEREIFKPTVDRHHLWGRVNNAGQGLVQGEADMGSNVTALGNVKFR